MGAVFRGYGYGFPELWVTISGVMCIDSRGCVCGLSASCEWGFAGCGCEFSGLCVRIVEERGAYFMLEIPVGLSQDPSHPEIESHCASQSQPHTAWMRKNRALKNKSRHSVDCAHVNSRKISIEMKLFGRALSHVESDPNNT